MYRLVFQNHGAPPAPVVVDAPSFVIGRDASCNLVLGESAVSGRHAAIERHTDGYYVHDLDSIGGVRVNGQSVAEQRLFAGDEIEVGGTRLVFEIVHGMGGKPIRRPMDFLQLLAVVVVLLVIGGQAALLSSMFAENRPKKVKLDVTPGGHAEKSKTTEIVSTNETVSSDLHPSVEAPMAGQPVPEPAVLNRMIRIVRVDRNENGGNLSVTIQAKAQVGGRELNPADVAMCVQFAATDSTGTGIVWRGPIWIPMPAWENFSTKAFNIKFDGAPHEFVGFVVRSYYRRQMQDVAASPPSLHPLAPNPPLGGAT